MCADRIDGARSNPDSGTAQFFICFDDARFLDNQYTVWGKVIEGMDNVDKVKPASRSRTPTRSSRRRRGRRRRPRDLSRLHRHGRLVKQVEFTPLVLCHLRKSAKPDFRCHPRL